MRRPGGARRYRGRVTAAPQADAVTGPVDARVACRFCGGTAGDLVLDLGEQPSSELFPAADDPGPDPLLPLRMWLCAGCGLAQLVGADDVTEEPLGFEPAALAAQRASALQRLVADGVLPERGTVAEYPSPHGGTWLPELGAHGLTEAAPGRPRGRRRRRLLRPDALPGPARRARRTGRPARARRRPAAAVPLPRRDRRRPAVERPASRPLRVLLDAGDGRDARRGRAHRHHRPPVPALRRHGPACRRPGTAGRRTPSPRSSTARRPRACATRPRCRRCRARSPARPSGCARPARPSGPPGAGCTATARRRAPSPCSGSPGSTRACSPPSPTPRRTSTAAGCPAPTSRSSRRTRWSRRARTSCCCSSPTWSPRSAPPCPQIEAAGGRWVDAGAGR